MLAKNIKTMSDNWRKWSQMGPKTSPKSILEGGLEATWEPPLKQGASKTSLFTILAPFWNPFWDQFGLMLGIMFLMFFWSGFLMALASIWAPKTPPKWDPKGCQNQNLNFIDFACIYNTWATFEGAENRHFSVLFWNTILEGPLGANFDDFDSHLGSLWGPFGTLFSTLFATSEKKPKKGSTWTCLGNGTGSA